MIPTIVSKNTPSKTAIHKTSPLSPVYAFSIVELRALGKVETIFKKITSEAP